VYAGSFVSVTVFSALTVHNVISAIFLLKKVPECKEWLTIWSERCGVSYSNSRKKRFWNAVPACILLSKNLWNGVPARSITKIP
jgi:hypothetical protein